ncbi:hypothetical protein BJ508DRAFT_333263 [Ascobolus immersus RN42]|uniref:Uncharacterized protein n=1 Tax=Ascobolus immersus RN42 TaxID=1160509 RepID=A0A3N4HX34_ASCIM|nr:hypothetical protein BJ508DRAFT_333263 [Ascobolus immersus RN42]
MSRVSHIDITTVRSVLGDHRQYPCLYQDDPLDPKFLEWYSKREFSGPATGGNRQFSSERDRDFQLFRERAFRQDKLFKDLGGGREGLLFKEWDAFCTKSIDKFIIPRYKAKFTGWLSDVVKRIRDSNPKTFWLGSRHLFNPDDFQAQTDLWRRLEELQEQRIAAVRECFGTDKKLFARGFSLTGDSHYSLQFPNPAPSEEAELNRVFGFYCDTVCNSALRRRDAAAHQAAQYATALNTTVDELGSPASDWFLHEYNATMSRLEAAKRKWESETDPVPFFDFLQSIHQTEAPLELNGLTYHTRLVFFVPEVKTLERLDRAGLKGEDWKIGLDPGMLENKSEAFWGEWIEKHVTMVCSHLKHMHQYRVWQAALRFRTEAFRKLALLLLQNIEDTNHHVLREYFTCGEQYLMEATELGYPASASTSNATPVVTEGHRIEYNAPAQFSLVASDETGFNPNAEQNPVPEIPDVVTQSYFYYQSPPGPSNL